MWPFATKKTRRVREDDGRPRRSGKDELAYQQAAGLTYLRDNNKLLYEKVIARQLGVAENDNDLDKMLDSIAKLRRLEKMTTGGSSSTVRDIAEAVAAVASNLHITLPSGQPAMQQYQQVPPLQLQEPQPEPQGQNVSFLDPSRLIVMKLNGKTPVQAAEWFLEQDSADAQIFRGLLLSAETDAQMRQILANFRPKAPALCDFLTSNWEWSLQTVTILKTMIAAQPATSESSDTNVAL